jgi:signal transduction histidine kinase
LNRRARSSGDFLEEQKIALTEILRVSTPCLEVKAAPDLIGVFDMLLMGVVIRNLVMNALRYAQHTILLSASVLLESQCLCFSIEDDCPGFSPVNSVPDHRAGTGLGLYFAEGGPYSFQRSRAVGQIILSNDSVWAALKCVFIASSKND